jgi:hypothetical protein
VKFLESGGRAATSTMDRLHDVQRRLELLDVQLGAMLLCREEELLAPLLKWGGTGASLRPALDGLEGSPRVPLEDDGQPQRPPGFRAAKAFHLQSGWSASAPVSGSPAPLPASRPEDARALLNPASAEMGQQVAAILSASAKTVWERSATGSPAEPGLLRRPAPELQESRELMSLVTAEEARRRLESRFADDERTARGWHQTLSAAEGTDLVTASPGEPGVTHAKVTETTPVDPVSRRLQSAVDRVMRGSAVPRTREVEPWGPSRGVQTSAVEDASRTVWDAPVAEERAGFTFAESPRRSGLRRLASLGESMEPERALSMPVPSHSSPIEEPPPPRAGLPVEREELAGEVADIFRREALRHGIVPEEDAP